MVVVSDNFDSNKAKMETYKTGLEVDKEMSTGKWVLFVLPLVTVMREGIVKNKPCSQ